VHFSIDTGAGVANYKHAFVRHGDVGGLIILEYRIERDLLSDIDISSKNLMMSNRQTDRQTDRQTHAVNAMTGRQTFVI
jgi:hypothetical protein